jgi:cysteine dioxygenase
MAVGSTPSNSAIDNAKPKRDQFQELVMALKKALGPSSGLTCDDVDINYLTTLMAEYDANNGGWQKYAMGDASRGYTRNLVDEGNGKSNLVRLSPLNLRELPRPPFS